MATDLIMPTLTLPSQSQSQEQSYEQSQAQLQLQLQSQPQPQSQSQSQFDRSPSSSSSATATPTTGSTTVFPALTLLPPSSTTSSSTNANGSLSPTSPRALAYPNRRPLFFPAALRRTEFPSRNCSGATSSTLPSASTRNAKASATSSSSSSPPSPISSYSSSLNNPSTARASVTPTPPPNTPRAASDHHHRSSGSGSSLLSLLSLRLNRRPSSAGDGAVRTPHNHYHPDQDLQPQLDLDLETFPEVTSQPTRRHWKPDLKSALCDDPKCKRSFNYFTRRHHCRRCGNIFCDFHSSHTVPLDEDANYNPRGSHSRSCDHCHAEYRSWCSRNNSLASSAASSASSTGPASYPTTTTLPSPTPRSPIFATPRSPLIPISTGASPMSKATATGVIVPGSVAASVPRDWNWSTF